MLYCSLDRCFPDTTTLPLRFCLKVSFLNDLNGLGPQSCVCSPGSERQQQRGCPPLPNTFQTRRANIPKQEDVLIPSSTFLRAQIVSQW